MELTQTEQEEFENTGFLFKPGAFSLAEAAVLRQAAADVYAMERKEVWREKTGAPRTAFAVHTCNDAFRCLGGSSAADPAGATDAG